MSRVEFQMRLSLVSQQIEREEKFAASIGATRSELQALPPAARGMMNRRFLSWCAAQ